MSNTIELTFIAAPKKYYSVFDKKSFSLKVYYNGDYRDLNGYAAYINGNIFCYWFNMNDRGVAKSIDFFFKGKFYNSNDSNLRVKLINVQSIDVPFTYTFEIVKDNEQIVSETFVSNAYNSYLLNVTYDDSDLEEDEILMKFIYYWDSLVKRKS